VVRSLAEYGVDPERLIATGCGETQSSADNNTEEGRQKNRRVQVVNLGYEKDADTPSKERS